MGWTERRARDEATAGCRDRCRARLSFVIGLTRFAVRTRGIVAVDLADAWRSVSDPKVA